MEILENDRLMDKFIKQFQLDQIFSDYSELPFRMVSYRAGEAIRKEGEVLKYFTFLVLGRVRSYSVTGDEKFRMIYRDAPCSIGGEEFLSDPRSPMTSEAVAEVLCLQIPMRSCHRLLRDDYKFYRFIGRELLEQLSLLKGEVPSSDDTHTTMDRAYAFLQVIADENTKEITRSLGEICETIGVSYRQMIRIMNGLCDDGRLIHGKKKGSYFLGD